ncbi:restriction endonuclease subunit S, partial [Reinekea sp.]|uniref:restriction endonuclease subunit S n=1 Tax=Reinekea sp. TaxID=1970455 RepID=UPI00257EF9E2
MGNYQHFPKYKYSGVDWISEIPVSWGIHPIKRTCLIFTGGTPRSGEANFWDGDVPWVTPADLGKSTTPYIMKGTKSITLEGYSACGTSLVPKDALILSSRAPIGTIGIASGSLCT